MYQVSCLYLQNNCQAHFWRYCAQPAVNCAYYQFRGHCACAEVISRVSSISEIDHYGFKSLCTQFHIRIYKITARPKCWQYGAQSAVNCTRYHYCGHCACAEVISRGGSISEVDQYGFKCLCTKFHACIHNTTIGPIFGAMPLS